MIDLSLQDIANRLGGRIVPSEHGIVADATVGGAVETDSREIQRGGVFVAKPGEVTDGHRFVGQARANGAVLAIVEHEVDEDITQLVVADAVVALGALARLVVERVKADGDLTVVGITGSNGKTTTKNMLAEILSETAPTVAPPASFNNWVGAPLTMLRITTDTRYLISEMGAASIGEITRLVRMAQPGIGVVLKVGLAHAGGFGGIERTVEAKSEMVTDLPADGVAVLNRDDPRVAGMAERTAARVLWFGLHREADVRATDVVSDRDGTRFTVHVPGGRSAAVSLKVLGEHHVMNALAALAVAHELGVDLDLAVAALGRMERAERWRMELLGGRDDVTVINDAYNASPDSMAAALKTLAQIGKQNGRTVAVLGAMSELGEFASDEHDRIGLQVVRLGISKLVVVGQDARRLHITAINEGSWDGESVYFETGDEAFSYLEGELHAGDTVLVKSSNSAGLRHLGDRLGELFSW